MKCWVCRRQARGLGHADVRRTTLDPRRYPIDWVFCSQRCQAAFHRLYGEWTRAQSFNEGTTVIDSSDAERAAMRLCLNAFGRAAADIGFDKPLGDYSEAQALAVIDAIVTRFTEAMVEHHETTRFPAIRGIPAVPDPMINPVADMDDDIPWEAN